MSDPRIHAKHTDERGNTVYVLGIQRPALWNPQAFADELAKASLEHLKHGREVVCAVAADSYVFVTFMEK